MEISFYEVPRKNSTFGEETFLKKITTIVIPQFGELIMFDDSIESYRVVDVSNYYENNECSIDILLVNSEKV